MSDDPEIPELDLEDPEYEGLITWDGFDEAFVGLVYRCGTSEPIACYDREKMIEIQARDMPYEDAVEFLEFNTFGAFVGERTPWHLERRTLVDPTPRPGLLGFVDMVKATPLDGLK